MRLPPSRRLVGRVRARLFGRARTRVYAVLRVCVVLRVYAGMGVKRA